MHRLFIELAKDENVNLRNFGIKAVEARYYTSYHKIKEVLL